MKSFPVGSTHCLITTGGVEATAFVATAFVAGLATSGAAPNLQILRVARVLAVAHRKAGLRCCSEDHL
jgi:hypothetical protein